ncbi:hypothetical protein [Deinococcus ruber]|uniref:Uncharacterized protein n=1 Tax=Deinococcus ruber TaxID=1848197 RepID=A0A918CPL1_9DEIO|nr:hypothetical protein [Deinococcus ruber]GGR34143.1 hypothetical protein GCM10008957_50440 [Deinococcus ruber]
MSKAIALYLPDGTTPAPATDFGSVPPGTTAASRQLLVKNTGTEAIPSLRMFIEQTSTADGEYHVTVGGLTLTGTAQEVLSSPLAAGATLSVTEYWSTPAGLGVTGPDTANLVCQFDQ